MTVIKKLKITRYKNSIKTETPDFVIREVPLTIFINGREYATLMCIPQRLEELIVGFLRGERIINSLQDVSNCIIDKKSFTADVKIKRAGKIFFDKRLITSACAAVALSHGNIKIAALQKLPVTLRLQKEIVPQLIKLFQKSCTIFEKTGGVHAAAISAGKEILFLTEDVGRHNAVDKVIGWCMLNSVDTSDKIILSTGRLSSEVVTKVATAQVQILISRSAPTDMAVKISKKIRLTIVGFARGKRFNIYSYPSRIV
ncbi:MAG: formate dehydrogenase accessory sulfurtransferase FdhD [Planctomycetota bacterium]